VGDGGLGGGGGRPGGVEADAAHEGKEEGDGEEHDGEEPEVVGVGEQLGLSDGLAVDHAESLALGGERVMAQREEVARPARQALRRLGVARRDVADQDGLVELTALGQERGHHGNTDAAAEIACHAVGGGGRHQLLARDPGQREGRQRHEDEADGEALDEAGERQGPVVHPERQRRHHVQRHGVEQAAETEHEALIDARHDAGREEREDVPDAAGRQHQA
jgi:hypothetical protein